MYDATEELRFAKPRTTEQGHMEMSSTRLSLVEAVYARLPRRAALGRERLGRPLTFAEKVLVMHRSVGPPGA
jgi:hypothetical protein